MPPEAAPVVAAPAPAAPAAPPPAAAPAAPEPAAARKAAAISPVIQKRYPTKAAAIGEPVRDARMGAPAPTAAPSMPAAPVQEAAAAPVESAAPATPETPAAPAAEVAPEVRLDGAELAKRTARLHKKEAAFQAERSKFDADKNANAQALRRLQLIDQARQTPKGQRLQLIRQAFGWSADDLINDVIGEQARPAAEVQARTAAEETVAPYVRQLNEAAETYNKRTQELQAQQYVDRVIVPAVADEKAYAFSRDEHGANLPQVILEIQRARYQQTGKVPEAKDVADLLEGEYRAKYERKTRLVSPSVKAPQPATPAASSPTANPKEQSARSPQQNPATRRFVPGKPYVTKMVGG